MIKTMSESGTKQRAQEREDASNILPHFLVGQLLRMGYLDGFY